MQTTSRGRVPWRRYRLSNDPLARSPVASKLILGLVVRVESMKLIDAQKRPDKAWFKVVHRANDLAKLSTSCPDP